MLRSLLDDAAIPFFVHNDNFGSLLAGPRIAHYNRKKILVHPADLSEARGLVQPVAEPSPARYASRRPYSTLDKARMVMEFLLFGWFLPGRRRRRPPPLRLIRGGKRDQEASDPRPPTPAAW